MRAIRCRQCGGAVAARPGERIPRCLFCGADALREEEVPEHLEQPEVAAPFAVDDLAAREAFSTFARSSVWYPSDLQRAGLDLRPLLLPAWAFEGVLEVHWTGLVSAPHTNAGHSPVSGGDTVEVPQVLIPASRSLLWSEVHALGPFDEAALTSFDPTDAPAPYELSELTRSAAMEQGLRRLEDVCAKTIKGREGLVRIRTSSILQKLEGRPVLVPVWIGTYRYGDRTFRVLVHGQTGHLVGDAPWSVWKILVAVFAVLLVVGTVAFCVLGNITLAALVQ